MGERKVLNKYIPPDFDPSKLPRGKREAQGRMEIRMMLPMNVQCLTCGNFMYKGTKFNSKKEDVLGEDYLGMKIFRFIMKCTQCNALWSIKTDPEHADYAVEYGVSRNFEPWREQAKATENAKAEREEEEKYDAMRALENRTEDSRRQLDMLDALDELKSIRARQAAAGLGPDALLAQMHSGNGAGDDAQAQHDQHSIDGPPDNADTAADDAEDDAMVRAAFAGRREPAVKRLREDSDGNDGAGATAAASASSSLARPAAPAAFSAVAAGPARPQVAVAGSVIGRASVAPVRAPVSVRPPAASAAAGSGRLVPGVVVVRRPAAAAAPATGDAAAQQSDAKRSKVEEIAGGTSGSFSSADAALPSSSSSQPPQQQVQLGQPQQAAASKPSASGGGGGLVNYDDDDDDSDA